ncbi:MAG: peroxiredoxin [Thermoleophilaceae bacterium]
MESPTSMTSTSYHNLPPDLPVPEDDGAADHLPGMTLPSLALRSTADVEVDLAEAAAGTLVLYVYPRTGTPGEPLLPGWDEIPGARGCTPQNCAFRDLHAELTQLGARVHGLSAQAAADQLAFARRERMPYPLLSDPELRLARALRLPTFEAGGMTLYKRLTLIARGGRIAHVVYPVFPPGSDAAEAVAWLRAGGRG